MYDVYLYGMISGSTVHLLDQHFEYPEANTYAEVARSIPSVGGEAVNSAIILSKLGVTTKLDGNWLNPLSSGRTLKLLEPFAIDTSRLVARQGYGTDEFVIADKTTRTVFGNYAGFHGGKKQWNDPVEEDVRQAGAVALDPYFRDESVRVAEYCVKHAVPYITLDCPYDGFLAQHAAALVISHELRDQTYPGEDPVSLFQRYQTCCPGLIIFTFGSCPLWYARNNETIRYFTPYPIQPVDTTGAGDAFRGAVTYGVLKSWSDKQTVEFASATAACVCMTVPHTLNAPGLDTINSFIEEQASRNAG